jgi:hypothetical protein
MKDIKNKTIDFLCMLEGYHSQLKMLHWSATHHALHILTDEIDEEVLKVEDEISECVMGILDTRFGIGDLKTMLPNSKTLDALLKEMKTDLIEFKNFVGDDAECAGLQNILDDYMQNINKWNYLRTLV